MSSVRTVPKIRIASPNIIGIQFEVFIRYVATDGAITSATKPALVPRENTVALSLRLALWNKSLGETPYLSASEVISQAIA